MNRIHLILALALIAIGFVLVLDSETGTRQRRLLRLAFKALRKAGRDPLRDPDAAELVELLAPVYNALAAQWPAH
ncbi:MAG: hypothetical protein J2P48_06545 [Alphaproteobacteria bacterium]|nr:hypothetical protein [Alphaproteobacteria bacterium]